MWWAWRCPQWCLGYNGGMDKENRCGRSYRVETSPARSVSEFVLQAISALSWDIGTIYF